MKNNVRRIGGYGLGALVVLGGSMLSSAEAAGPEVLGSIDLRHYAKEFQSIAKTFDLIVNDELTRSIERNGSFSVILDDSKDHLRLRWAVREVNGFVLWPRERELRSDQLREAFSLNRLSDIVLNTRSHATELAAAGKIREGDIEADRVWGLLTSLPPSEGRSEVFSLRRGLLSELIAALERSPRRFADTEAVKIERKWRFLLLADAVERAPLQGVAAANAFLAFARQAYHDGRRQFGSDESANSMHARKREYQRWMVEDIAACQRAFAAAEIRRLVSSRRGVPLDAGEQNALKQYDLLVSNPPEVLPLATFASLGSGLTKLAAATGAPRAR